MDEPITDGAFAAVKEAGSAVVLPDDAASLYEIALKAICSRGCPSHLSPMASVIAIATFALGLRGNPGYDDGGALLKAALAQGALDGDWGAE